MPQNGGAWVARSVKRLISWCVGSSPASGFSLSLSLSLSAPPPPLTLSQNKFLKNQEIAPEKGWASPVFRQGGSLGVLEPPQEAGRPEEEVAGDEVREAVGQRRHPGD